MQKSTQTTVNYDMITTWKHPTEWNACHVAGRVGENKISDKSDKMDLKVPTGYRDITQFFVPYHISFCGSVACV